MLPWTWKKCFVLDRVTVEYRDGRMGTKVELHILFWISFISSVYGEYTFVKVLYTGWPVIHGRSGHYSVTFYEVPNNTAMYNWSSCTKTRLLWLTYFAKFCEQQWATSKIGLSVKLLTFVENLNQKWFFFYKKNEFSKIWLSGNW